MTDSTGSQPEVYTATGPGGEYSLSFQIAQDHLGQWSIYTRDDSDAVAKTTFQSYEEAASIIEGLKAKLSQEGFSISYQGDPQEKLNGNRANDAMPQRQIVMDEAKIVTDTSNKFFAMKTALDAAGEAKEAKNPELSQRYRAAAQESFREVKNKDDIATLTAFGASMAAPWVLAAALVPTIAAGTWLAETAVGKAVIGFFGRKGVKVGLMGTSALLPIGDDEKKGDISGILTEGMGRALPLDEVFKGPSAYGRAAEEAQGLVSEGTEQAGKRLLPEQGEISQAMRAGEGKSGVDRLSPPRRPTDYELAGGEGWHLVKIPKGTKLYAVGPQGKTTVKWGAFEEQDLADYMRGNQWHTDWGRIPDDNLARTPIVEYSVEVMEDTMVWASKVTTQPTVGLPHIGKLANDMPARKVQYWHPDGLGVVKEERILAWVPAKNAP
jgi:hypothetical protein